jgi:hypothetical protein
MWLLDVNVPQRIVAVLREFGVDAETAGSRGWDGLANGRLVDAAVHGGFTCLLTRDRLFGESAARTLKDFPQFSVVLLALPQLRGPQFLEQFRVAWRVDPIQPVPGKLIHWPPD